VEYVGRAFGGWDPSPLGNPFKIGLDGTREECLLKYRVHLWNAYRTGQAEAAARSFVDTRPRSREEDIYFAIGRLAARHVLGDDIVLGCWCAPKACHAETIRAIVEWLGERLRGYGF